MFSLVIVGNDNKVVSKTRTTGTTSRKVRWPKTVPVSLVLDYVSNKEASPRDFTVGTFWRLLSTTSWDGTSPTPWDTNRATIGTRIRHVGVEIVQYITDFLQRYQLHRRSVRNSDGTVKVLFNRNTVTMHSSWSTPKYCEKPVNRTETNLPVNHRRNTLLSRFCRVVSTNLVDFSCQHHSKHERPRIGRVNTLVLNAENVRSGNSYEPCWWSTLTITTEVQFWTGRVNPNAGTSDFTVGWYQTSTVLDGNDDTVSIVRRIRRFLGSVSHNDTLDNFLFFAKENVIVNR